MVRRVAGRRERLPAERPRRRRRGCSPRAPARARPRACRTGRRRAGARALEPRRVDEVRRAELGDPDLSARGARGRSSRPRPHGRGGCARGAGGGCRRARAPRSRRPSSARERRGRAAVEEGGAVGRLQQVDADRALEPAETEVDRKRQRADGRRGRRDRDESAGSRSASRSSTASIPTERRTRLRGAANGASAVEACVIRAGCSIRLSTPPSDSASGKSFVRADERDRLLLRLRRGTRPCRRSRASAARAISWPGMRSAGRGRARARRRRARRGSRRSARAFSQCWRMRTRERLDPAQHEPRSRTGRVRRRATSAGSRAARRSSGRSCATKPPITSEWPPRYFVVEWTTRSAPSSSGCCRYGVANVLSTTSSAPTACAASAARADVDDVQQRVRRRLDPDDARVARRGARRGSRRTRRPGRTSKW